jgi:RHS repeat-associated protein
MAHLPFGDDFAQSGTQEKHHLTSYERDSELGSDYAVNRQYSQTIGRFNRVDPAQAKINDPQTQNRYNYTRNDPINFADPLGLWCEWWLHLEYWDTGVDIIIDYGASYLYLRCFPDQSGGGGGPGNGTAGGGPVPGQGTEISRHNAREFKRRVLSSNCKNALDQKGLTDAIIGAVDEVQFFDVDNPDIGQADASVYFPEPEAAGLSVDAYFRRYVDPSNPDLTGAHTVPLGYPFAGIYARGGVGAFINAQGVDTGFLMHELAHYTTGKNDFGLWQMFDLPPPPQGMTYTDVVSSFFNNDCPGFFPTTP